MKRLAALFAFSAAALALAVAACDRYPLANDDDLLSVRLVCPDGRATCPAIANGAAVIAVEACTKAQNRVDNLKVVLRIAPLEWQNPTDPTQKSVFTASLTGNPCVIASFVTRNTPDLVRIDADLGGFRPDPIWIQTIPADVTDLELIPQPAFLTTNTTSNIKLSTLVLTSAGKATVGTKIQFDVISVVPPTGSAYLWPGSAIVDTTRTPPIAEANLTTGPSVKSVMVQMTAIPPAVDGVPEPTPFVQQFTLAGNH